MAWKVEVTDTYGGQANYSWVRRYHMEEVSDEKQPSIVRRAKKLAGWTGFKCETMAYNGDTYEVRPRRAAMVMFVSWDESNGSDT
jgi:hypothetical protein